MPPKATPRRQPARRNPRANATPSEEANSETNPTVTVDEGSQPASDASASNSKAQDNAPRTAPPPRPPVQRLQSLKRRPASATTPVPGQPVTKAPLKFQPKAAPRKSKEERDRVAKLEAEKQQARLAAAAGGAQDSSRGGARGGGAFRGVRGRGTFNGPVRGGWQGRGGRHDQGAMSGPFGAGFYAREETTRKVGRGESRFSTTRPRGLDRVKNEPGVKPEGGAVVGGSSTSGGVRIKTEDYGEMYVSSEDEEHKNEGPRMNIEQINLVSDEESDEENSVTNKGKGRAKESRSTGFVLKPIRLDRKEHVERAAGVNTEASSMTSAEMRKRAKERGGQGDSLFLPMDDENAAMETAKKKGKGKTKDVEFLRDERKWKGVYEDEKDKSVEPRIKDEPMDDDDHPAVNLPAATIAPTTGLKPPEPASLPAPPSATSDNADPSTNVKPKAKKKRTLKFEDTKPVLQTEEDRQEWARYQEDIRMLDHELRLMDTGPTTLSVPRTDADGNVTTEEDDTPKITEQKEGRVYLIQLPPIVPSLIDPDPTPDANPDPDKQSNNIKPDPEAHHPHPTPASPSTQKPQSSSTATKKAAIPAITPNLKPLPRGTFSPGHLGTLKLKQSGRVLLSWGAASLELARGSETEFLQDVVVANAKKHFTIDDELTDGEEERGRGAGNSGWGLGQVMGGFVLRPDWGRVFGGG